ncbi:metallopeptidase TldD-related protein [Marinactinospora thermotolerans]|uniref:metallopeptidase TldD-related protein n=1 Tax=Marinactinospora thermotolerans TaxID=531310 RepID=UPI001F1758E6|nr:metallopeptidase TldD-related protein [Marinactinospora thermotolerans]
MNQSASPQEIVERALGLSRSDDCMVIVSEDSTANLRWAGNSLTTNGLTRGRTVTVVSLTGGRAGVSAGVVRRSGLRDDLLEDLVRAAEAASRDAPPAEEARPLITPEQAPATDWDSPPAETGIAVFERFAPRLGAAFERARGRGNLLYGYAEHTMSSTYLGTSSGVRLRHDQPSGTVDINAKSGESASGAAHSAWVGRATRDFADIDVEALAAELDRRLAWGRRRVDLPAGRYETVLPPEAVADLMINLYFDIGARDAFEGRTAFSAPGGGTRVGERLAGLPLTLRSDPAQPGLECAPFVLSGAPGRWLSAFDNGLPRGPVEWVRKGELAALGQTRHSAELTGLPLTPPVDNLVLELPGATATLDDLVAGTTRGLLLTCLWYIRTVDPQTMLLTGLTRDGVYLVEDGEVVGAVNNFRFNESPVGLLGRISEAGASVAALSREVGDFFPRSMMPPVRVPDFNMSTVSQAS